MRSRVQTPRAADVVTRARRAPDVGRSVSRETWRRTGHERRVAGPMSRSLHRLVPLTVLFDVVAAVSSGRTDIWQAVPPDRPGPFLPSAHFAH